MFDVVSKIKKLTNQKGPGKADGFESFQGPYRAWKRLREAIQLFKMLQPGIDRSLEV